MSIVAFINQKGGVSKSTSAVHYAVWLFRQGLNTILIDTDIQHSATVWVQNIEDELPCISENDPDKLLDLIDDSAENYDFVVIDGPAKLAETTRAVLLKSDLAIIPCAPTGLDLNSAFSAIKTVRQAQKIRGGLPEARLFLSRASKGTKLLEEAREALSEFDDIPLLDKVIFQRQAIADSFGQGLTVFDMRSTPAKIAGRDFKELFELIKGA